jgi:hypothetical protein
VGRVLTLRAAQQACAPLSRPATPLHHLQATGGPSAAQQGRPTRLWHTCVWKEIA